MPFLADSLVTASCRGGNKRGLPAAVVKCLTSCWLDLRISQWLVSNLAIFSSAHIVNESALSLKSAHIFANFVNLWLSIFCKLIVVGLDWTASEILLHYVSSNTDSFMHYAHEYNYPPSVPSVLYFQLSLVTWSDRLILSHACRWPFAPSVASAPPPFTLPPQVTD